MFILFNKNEQFLRIKKKSVTKFRMNYIKFHFKWLALNKKIKRKRREEFIYIKIQIVVVVSCCS